jgi:hypothetical protein
MVRIFRQGPLFPMIKNLAAPGTPPEQKFLIFDDMLDFEDFRCFGSTEGEGAEGEGSVTSCGYLQRPY